MRHHRRSDMCLSLCVVRVGQVVKFCARNEKASLSRTEPKAQEKKRKEFED